MKQTELTLEELQEELEIPISFPKCFIINEIGIVGIGEDDEARGAQECLLKLLDGENISDRHLAFCWLSSIREKTGDVVNRLKEFEKKPRNTVFIEIAKEQIEENKSLFAS